MNENATVSKVVLFAADEQWLGSDWAAVAVTVAAVGRWAHWQLWTHGYSGSCRQCLGQWGHMSTVVALMNTWCSSC